MLVSFGLLLVLTGAATGSLMIPVCRFNQSDLCYEAVGHSLYLQLPSEYELILKKSSSGNTSTQIVKIKDQNITYKHPNYSRWQFVINNRSVIISSAEKTDSGRYSLDTFDSGGTTKGVYRLQLVIEDVVSSVDVTYSCLSSKRGVYCSSNGENVQYSWTFSGGPQADDLSDGNKTLLLDKEAVGSVTCYAQNHVSREHNTTELPPCPDTLLIVMGSCAVLLLMLSIGVFFVYRKKQAAKKKDSPEDGGELVYADVSHKPTSGVDRAAPAQEDTVEYATVNTRTSRKKQQQKEDEVQYGELVFNTGRTNQHNKQPVEQDECVYSQVQRKC